MANPIKQMMAEGKTAVGSFIGIYSPSLAEMLGHSGFDFVVIDNEHGSYSWGEVENMIRACELAGTTPIVRIVNSTQSEILKALDRGAKGIHVPQINTGAEARAVVEAAKFPPHGTRGVAYSVRAAKYGLNKGSSYLQGSNDDVLVCVHIETPQAVENVDEIMTSGIDLAFIGPTDLSVSAGYPDNPDHPELEAMRNRVLESGRKHGIPVGILSTDRAGLDRFRNWGASYVGINFTSMLYSAFTSITR
ncbi:HpcH/HpaI aldolase family protein [Paenibacillus hamazuiensis]|uniref:HpcH/HpaI aldolase family protein n=1 Tax=Paenibacillus hamazuiensis TaxID=2936508 RepID=UPI00200C6C0B|nr:aldolase/citrate lyase family protein [Paenibacillus hamazuiensis]